MNTTTNERTGAMRLHYSHESEGPRYYVLSALGVHAERWSDLAYDIREWREGLRDRYGIPAEWGATSR